MKRWLVLLVVLAAARSAAGEDVSFLAPYESGTGFVARDPIDVCVLQGLEAKGIRPANPCSDAVFLRRIYVDLIGTLPEAADAHRFLADEAQDKRARLVDALMDRDEFVDYWTLKWCDLLRVKAEFPINLWPNGVQAYHRWIHDAVRENMPLDRFARALLTASGSNFRVPPVNFYRAVQGRTPQGLASAVALTFMGARFESWPAARREGMAALFSRLAFKMTAEWKEEIITLDPAPAGPLEAVLPDGTPVTIAPGEDPRRVFADWLLRPDNPVFARSLANRAWSWFFGRGVIHEPDDLRPDNPPANPALLDCLARTLVESGYDMRALFRRIVNSRTYQGSSIPQSDKPEATALFACYPVRRLDAEVLIDALCRLDGVGENYVSQVPEPFTILPDLKRSIRLADGSITSPFLEMFGRPARDSGLETERDNEPTDAQVLYLLNSRDVQRRITNSRWLRRLVGRARRDRLGMIPAIYEAILSRGPTREELAVAAAYVGRDERKRKTQEAALDLAWALINSKEFLYRH